MSHRFAIAPHFHLDEPLGERLLFSAAGGWRAPSVEELANCCSEPANQDELNHCVRLFALPAHLREAFWDMLEHAQRGDESRGNFTTFAAEVASFLAFKHLPLPGGATCELVLARPGQPAGLDTGQLWGVVNLGEDETLVEFEAVRLRLKPGEGCRIPARNTFDVIPPERETPDMLLVIRE